MHYCARPMAIELNRRFVECKDDGKTDPNLIASFGRSDFTLGWDDVLKRRRVVLLAEAGSGKTTELISRARSLPAEMGDAFYATVEDVGRLGLDGALRAADRERLKAWRASDREAWFFIDSVDEAKNSGVRLPSVLCNLADRISGAERRAHIILSGRYTDWEFRRDLALVRDDLKIPPHAELPAAPTPDELVISVVHGDLRRAPSLTPEEVLVVVMAGLDEERVRQFAVGKGVADVDALLAQIDRANLWQFARRPLDLDWLTEFWKANGSLGSLADMLRVCVAERLQESNTDRARQDDLDVDRAAAGLERVAATLVFGRRETISIPDAEIDLSADPDALDLGDALSDWSAQDRSRLITRAVFDPATFGRARLHNDNQGVVRGYLTARWLHRLRGVNLSKQALHDLFFAETYGVPVIKPSMLETAAWLSLSDEGVAQEVVKRNPFLLLSAGDPQSLSRATRELLLREVVKRLARGQRLPPIDFDGLRRFSSPDLADEIRRLFSAHGDNAEVRHLLLRIIWVGEIKAAADLAEKAAFSGASDRYTLILAGRALMATGDRAARDRYAARVKANAGTQPTTIVWDALSTIFPESITVTDVLDILSRIDVTDRDGGLSLDYIGPKLVPKNGSTADLDALLKGALAQLGGAPSAGDREETKRESAYFPLVTATASRLLELSADDQVPPSALDALARIGDALRASRRAREPRPDLVAQLGKSAARRRQAFWHFAASLKGHRMLGGRPISSIFDMSILGWPIDMSEADVDWLLADAPSRASASERQLAINTAMHIWSSFNRPEALCERIAAIVGRDADMSAAYTEWTTPRTRPPGLLESEKRLEELTRRNALERAAHDKSWTDFASDMRNDPTKLLAIKATTAEGADPKIYHLWQLLSQASSDQQYALDSVTPLEPMIGREATENFRQGLIAHWRLWTPWLRSGRKNEELSLARNLDAMGLTAITLEAKDRPNWARDLNDGGAKRAAEYATLELTGFPVWLVELAAEKPTIVRDVLAGELKAELARPPEVSTFGVAQSIATADARIAELMAPAVVEELEAAAAISARSLSMLLDIAKHAKGPVRDRLKALVTKRFRSVTEPESESLYGAIAFALDPQLGTTMLFDRLKGITVGEQAALVQRVLPLVFGGHFGRDEPVTANIPLDALERLVRLAYRAIRPEDDIEHPNGEVYSPGPRDNAEHARGAIVKRVVTTPGRAAFDAMARLKADSALPISKAYLEECRVERAAVDSESAPWPAAEALQFERSFETQPSTPRDLLQVALRRLADMQHDLVNDDFQQGETLALLPDENAVQRWIADRMRLKQGRSYSVDREVHVADEKEPDVRLRSKVTDANVPIEVKVAESWTLPKLEEALLDQLCAKYLRARDGRYGVLLLVHQKPRPRGWISKSGTKLTFEEVVGRLKKVAAHTAGESVDAPQPEIAVIDVTRFATTKKKAVGKAKTRTNAKKRTEKKAVTKPKPPAKSKATTKGKKSTLGMRKASGRTAKSAQRTARKKKSRR